MTCRVSVLMVSHNAGPYLQRAVQSIWQQTERNLELVLVDNASTDGSVADLRARCADPRLRIVPLERNLFHNGGLNQGLPHCRGEFIAILDADDLSLPDRLARQVARLRSDAGLGGVGAAAATIDAEDRITGRAFTLAAPDACGAFLRYDMPCIFSTLTVRREVFDQVGGFHPALATSHDLHWLARVGERHSFAALPEVLLHYRQHPGSTTSRKLWEIRADASAVRIAGERRRAGRPEALEDLLALKAGWRSAELSVGGVFVEVARLALREGWLFQAVWHARKAAQAGRALGALSVTLAALRSARRAQAADFPMLLRLAGLGTVRAYGLQPMV